MRLIRTTLAVLVAITDALVWEDGTGKLPAMGWNSWNTYECNISATLFLDQAQAMIDHGFLDSGYNYVNLDDCWSLVTGRDKVTKQLVPDLDKFPDGISGLADQIHDMGFKIGIYSSAGTETCAGYPASIGYESIDAASWAAWGIDYLKYDNCNVPADWTDECPACVASMAYPQLYGNGTCPSEDDTCPSGYNYTASKTAERYRVMRDALTAQNRTIQYSICVWGYQGVEEWGNQTGNSWRISTDIEARWSYITSILNMNTFQMDRVDFWGHNDADMLEVGNLGLTYAEARSHFAFWAAMKSPLIMSADLTTMSKEYIDVLKNEYLIAFNQDDVYGAAAKPYKWGYLPDYTWNETYPAQYWAGESKQGTLVLMLNTLDVTKDMTVDFSEVPYLEANGTYHILDAWSGDCLGSFTNSATVPVASHDTAVLVFQYCGKFLL
ncbi:family 27 glycoside hydrolase [Cryphonectria parasitica EP155]|uniref:Alpha-galactosidase n=1 Tax=Cryphonectria parasitica (strain ATCC 38755 / EP155) TaxID=660469 RepID=A0A9P4XUN4_CRYP1|nr:family 27 glycoside hydrolase [Cryphonectria parasitica EP155]KAF3761213.1 family 27 glycoside hydrolase [Cryphonectria parasitica EP155]